jgi:ABC-type phosphate transport system permease subunit
MIYTTIREMKRSKMKSSSSSIFMAYLFIVINIIWLSVSRRTINFWSWSGSRRTINFWSWSSSRHSIVPWVFSSIIMTYWWSIRFFPYSSSCSCCLCFPGETCSHYGHNH